MDFSSIRFKLNKLWQQYRRHGAKYAFSFVAEKVKKNYRNRNAGESFYKASLLSEKQVAEAVRDIEQFMNPPVLSILMPVYNVEERWLVKAIESVLNQLYPHWELCIADDASTQEHIKPVLQKYAAQDPRIKVVYRRQSGNISEATNSALELATGTFIALLDNDDELSEDALYAVAGCIREHPEADWIYSDEDKIDEQNRHFKFDLKPDWSPELLHAYMYTCHFTVYRKSLVKQLGSFRKAFDGSQDYDLALRMSQITDQIYHIPKVLYHWRTIAQSTASNPLAKKYAYEAGRKALEEHLHATGLQASVDMTDSFGVYKVNYKIKGDPLVSIVIPSAGKSAIIRGKETCLLENCITRARQLSAYKNIEWIVIDGFDVAEALREQLIKTGVRWISCEHAFNFSERINLGVNAAKGEYVLLLNDDTEPIEPDWIRQLLGLAQQQNIGAVGAKLITAQHQIQHAGIVMYEGSPLHVSYGSPDVGQGYLNAYVANRNFLAVTAACLMVSKAKYDEAGGMDETFPVNFNDVDLCLKLHERGYRNVYAAHAKLFHYESVSRRIGYKPEELIRFVKKWEYYQPAQQDPYYNPNLVAYPSLGS